MPPPKRTVRGAPRASAWLRERVAAEGSELSRVKRALAERGLAPLKRMGQNFLVREDLARRIVEHCRLEQDDVVVEIGPGAGALTARLAARVRTLIAVEKDTGLAALLREELAEVPQFELVEGDFLEFDLAEAARAHGVERVVVVGNIPYNITTPVLERIFEQKRAVKSAVLLVQKEYAERLAAAAGTPEYGSLTLFARYHALLDPLLAIRASAFWPRPDVDSMLVRFFLREQPPVEADEALLFRIIRGVVPHAPQAAREHARGNARARARGHRAPLPRRRHRQPPPRRDAHARGVREARAGRGADRAGAGSGDGR